jgi:hypothetical protein
VEIVKCFEKPRVTSSRPSRLSDARLNMVARLAAESPEASSGQFNFVID